MDGLIEIEKRIEKMIKLITRLKQENKFLKEKIYKLEQETSMYQKESEDILLTIESLVQKEQK